jgi:DNA replication protein DnaD
VTQKREKFRELAEGRTTKALDAIARIGNLSNRQVYEYEDAEVKKIMRALRDAVAEVEARFEAPRTRKSGFKL